MHPKRSSVTRRRRRRRLAVLGASAAFVGLLLSGLVWFNLSSGQLTQRVVAALERSLAPGCSVRVGAAVFSLTKGLVVRDLAVCAPEPFQGKECARVRYLNARLSLISLLAGRIAFSKIELAGCRLEAAFHRQGGLNLACLFQDQGGERKKRRTVPVEFNVRDIVLSVGPRSLAELAGVPVLGEVSPSLLAVTFYGAAHRRGDTLHLQGTAFHPVLERIAVSGSYNYTQKSCDFDFAVEHCTFSRDIVPYLPERLRKELLAYDPYLEGRVNLNVKGTPPEKVEVRLSGRFRNGRITLVQLPYPVRELEATWELAGGTLRIERLSARVGDGTLTASGAVKLTGAEEDRRGRIQLELDRIRIDERVGASLPEEAQKVWDAFHAAGEISLSGEVGMRGAAFEVSGTCRLLGVTAQWNAFPYPVHDLQGVLRYDGRVLATEGPLTGKNGSTTISVTGQVETRPKGALSIQLQAQDLRCDRTLYEALDPAIQAVWDSFEAGGTLDALCELTRESGMSEVTPVVTLRFKDGRMRYVHFPLPLRRVRGEVVITKGSVKIHDLRGYHGSTEVVCRTGLWRKQKGTPQFGFVFESLQLPVYQDLRQALGPTGRRVLEDFGFEGRVKTEVKLFRTGEDKETQLEIDAAVLEGSVCHRNFPYRLELEGGRIFISRASIRIENLQGTHGPFSLTCTRGVVREKGPWREYDLALKASRLTPDPELTEALPEHIRRFLKGLSVRGVFDVPSFSLQYRHDVKNPERFELTYTTEVRTSGAAMDMGLRFREIQGWARIIGKAGGEYPHKATGELKIKSLRFNRLRLNDLELNCTYGRRNPLLEKLSTVRPPLNLPRLDTDTVLARYPNDEAAYDSFQVWIKSGKAYSGRVRGFCAVDVGKKRDVIGQVFVRDVDLQEASADVFHTREALGKGEVIVLFHGKVGNAKSLRGTGEVKLREANLVRLPLFVGILNVLRLQPIQDTYFRRVVVRFVLEDGKFKAPTAQSITMESDLLSLQGGGTMDFDLKLDLYLSLPSLGLPHIPVVSDVIRRLVDNIAVFHVSGPVDSPTVRVVPIKDVLSLFGRGK